MLRTDRLFAAVVIASFTVGSAALGGEAGKLKSRTPAPVQHGTPMMDGPICIGATGSTGVDTCCKPEPEPNLNGANQPRSKASRRK